MANEQKLIDRIKGLCKEKKGKNLPTAELVNLLAEVAEGNYTKGYVIMASPPSGMKKTGNPFVNRVIKLSGWGFDTNADYSRKVNLQREREGKAMDFEALPTYCEAINKVVYRSKKEADKLYMSVYPTPNFGQFTEYYVDGRLATPVEVLQIKEFLPDRSTSSRQGTDKVITIRRPLISNIQIISLGGKRHAIKENLAALQDMIGK